MKKPDRYAVFLSEPEREETAEKIEVEMDGGIFRGVFAKEILRGLRESPREEPTLRHDEYPSTARLDLIGNPLVSTIENQEIELIFLRIKIPVNIHYRCFRAVAVQSVYHL